MVMAVDGRKSAKRPRRGDGFSSDLQNFFIFPEAAEQSGAFRDAVQAFLSSHARFTFPPSSLFSSFMTWEILLRVGDLTEGPDLSPVVVSLYVVEEDVTKSSRSVYCDHCRVVGWSGHPVCRKRYHFIIRSSDGSNVKAKGFQKPCSRCGTSLSGSSCKWCSSAAPSDDFEDWVYALFDDPSHLLHGVVHANGYGHLLTVNGREGGSKFLSGRGIVDFWDRLCKRLAVRMITVMDMSRKHGLDYRLLHVVAQGHSWYGNWGYELKSGSYALSKHDYQNALTTLCNIDLETFLYERRKPRMRLHNIIAFYQSSADSKLQTLRDLFSYLLKLIHQTHQCYVSGGETEYQYSPEHCSSWAGRDVECVQEAFVKILKVAGSDKGWVSRRALKGVKRKASSPELIDYCLKHLRGKQDGAGMIVQARFNPEDNDVEFRLQHNALESSGAKYPPTDQVIQDLQYLYKCLLDPETMLNQNSQFVLERAAEAAKVVLDCKQFVKDYIPFTDNPLRVSLWCQLELSDNFRDGAFPPAELILLDANATVKDLKIEAAKAFQNVYAMFKRLEVEALPDYNSINESLTLKFLFGHGGSIRIRGRCSSMHGLLRYRMERGLEDWKVDCMCGAKDDDGERMLACDDCGVWQHTRCLGIQKADALPSKFLCSDCAINSHSCKDIRNSSLKDNRSWDTLRRPTCRGGAISMHDHGAGSLSVTLRAG